MDVAIRTVVAHLVNEAMPPLVGVLANAFPLIEKTYGGANASLHDLRADITPSAYADYAVKWAALGASIIGGCCGISPDHLHEVKTRLIG